MNQAADTRPPAIFLMGPTASGKTGLALALRKRFPVELVSVDSAQVYRGLDVGTAKPDADTLVHAPHRLVDIRDPAESYSAAEFREDALAEMADICGSGRVPLLVGGTMLYFRALTRGLAPLPSASPDLRRRIEAEARQAGWPALHRKLADRDPELASRIHPNDPQRIQRALEVIEITGRPMSELQREHRERTADTFAYRVLRLVVCPADRSGLHSRIEHRFRAMLDEGLLQEVARLRQRDDLGPELPALRSVGYRQAWKHLAGEIDHATMVRQALAASRQLAKRQLTWLRQEPGALWYDSMADTLVPTVSEKVGSFLADESP